MCGDSNGSYGSFMRRVKETRRNMLVWRTQRKAIIHSPLHTTHYYTHAHIVLSYVYPWPMVHTQCVVRVLRPTIHHPLILSQYLVDPHFNTSAVSFNCASCLCGGMLDVRWRERERERERGERRRIIILSILCR